SVRRWGSRAATLRFSGWPRGWTNPGAGGAESLASGEGVTTGCGGGGGTSGVGASTRRGRTWNWVTTRLTPGTLQAVCSISRATSSLATTPRKKTCPVASTVISRSPLGGGSSPGFSAGDETPPAPEGALLAAAAAGAAAGLGVP